MKTAVLSGGAIGSVIGGVIYALAFHGRPWVSLWLMTVFSIAALVSWAVTP